MNWAFPSPRASHQRECTALHKTHNSQERRSANGRLKIREAVIGGRTFLSPTPHSEATWRGSRNVPFLQRSPITGPNRGVSELRDGGRQSRLKRAGLQQEHRTLHRRCWLKPPLRLQAVRRGREERWSRPRPAGRTATRTPHFISVVAPHQEFGQKKLCVRGSS